MARTPLAQVSLLSGVTTVSTSSTADMASFDGDERNFVAHISGTGAVSATVLVEVSNNNVHFFTLATIELSGTTSATDGFVSDESWQFIRGRVTAISGTGAAVTLTMGA
jgi:hypothetical protein